MSLTELRLPAVGLGLLASGMLLLGSPATAAEVLSGVPRTVDGDTLVVRTAASLVCIILSAAMAESVDIVQALRRVTLCRHQMGVSSRWATPGCDCTASTPRRASSSVSTVAAASSPAVGFLSRHCAHLTGHMS